MVTIWRDHGDFLCSLWEWFFYWFSFWWANMIHMKWMIFCRSISNIFDWCIPDSIKNIWTAKFRSRTSIFWHFSIIFSSFWKNLHALQQPIVTTFLKIIQKLMSFRDSRIRPRSSMRFSMRKMVLLILCEVETSFNTETFVSENQTVYSTAKI